MLESIFKMDKLWPMDCGLMQSTLVWLALDRAKESMSLKLQLFGIKELQIVWMILLSSVMNRAHKAAGYKIVSSIL
jgi:hypothetical protein